ncbi:neuronal PAS domain-containing protein 1 isoform X4 [Saccopteryx leptura]|uniref:neuronal PAS domain-containing protein 1 isoform X4 n=1 Tax=Saccopteryx leptura TaxID=249018 RepID=UPI00339C2400
MTAPYPISGGGGEVKCGAGRGGSVPWDFLPGLMVKASPGPCLQAQRKEKSRNAARSRRGKENLEFFELAKLLPLPGAISSQLDKASIVRLCVTYLRLRRFATLGAPPWGLRASGPQAGLGLAPGRRGSVALVSEVFEQHLGGHILQSLDGFVFALNQEGKFLYISETVSIYLGLSQVELTGSSVFDYIHPGDHSEVLEQLGLRTRTSEPPTPPSVPSSSSSSSSSSSLADTPEIEASPTEVSPSSQVQERSFFIRMKSTLTKRGLHMKASGYKVIHVTGRLRARSLGLVALGHTLPPAPLAELPLHGHMIVFRLSLDLTILAWSATTWTWGPRSWWAAAATSLSTDRMQPESAKATWTVRTPPSASCHPDPSIPSAPLPGSPASGMTIVPAVTNFRDSTQHRRAARSSEQQRRWVGIGLAAGSQIHPKNPGAVLPRGLSDSGSLSPSILLPLSPPSHPSFPWNLVSPLCTCLPLSLSPLCPSSCPPHFLHLSHPSVLSPSACLFLSSCLSVSPPPPLLVPPVPGLAQCWTRAR